MWCFRRIWCMNVALRFNFSEACNRVFVRILLTSLFFSFFCNMEEQPFFKLQQQIHIHIKIKYKIFSIFFFKIQ